MPIALVVTDVPWVRSAVHAALPGPEYALVDHDEPGTAGATAAEHVADVAIVDLQVKSMGGMAVARALRESGARSGRRVPCVMLLDRAADTFLARRAGADAWLTKPFDDNALRVAVATALDAAAASTSVD